MVHLSFVLFFVGFCAREEFLTRIPPDLKGHQENEKVNLRLVRAMSLLNRPMAKREVGDMLLNAEDRQKVVDTHNRYRGMEKASDMEYMEYNDVLAAHAVKAIKNCQFKHSHIGFDGSSIGMPWLISVGQNMYFTTGKANPVRAVTRWWEQKPKYDMETGKCDGVCGHYSQLVWAQSQFVGCAAKQCGAVRFEGKTYANSWLMACDYAPPGNYRANFPFTPGPPCRKCRSGKFWCYKNLCRENCDIDDCECNAKCYNCASIDCDCSCNCRSGWRGPHCRMPVGDEKRECRRPHVAAQKPRCLTGAPEKSIIEVSSFPGVVDVEPEDVEVSDNKGDFEVEVTEPEEPVEVTEPENPVEVTEVVDFEPDLEEEIAVPDWFDWYNDVDALLGRVESMFSYEGQKEVFVPTKPPRPMVQPRPKIEKSDISKFLKTFFYELGRDLLNNGEEETPPRPTTQERPVTTKEPKKTTKTRKEATKEPSKGDIPDLSAIRKLLEKKGVSEDVIVQMLEKLRKLAVQMRKKMVENIQKQNSFSRILEYIDQMK